MDPSDSDELSSEEWRQWMADRIAARVGQPNRAAVRKANHQRRQAQQEIDAEAKVESDAVHAWHQRPRTRGECGTERPCPWISCRMHLYVDINPETGSIKIHFPDLDPWELEHSCALDIADEGGITLEAVAATFNVSRERIRQLEAHGKRTLRMAARQRGLG